LEATHWSTRASKSSFVGVRIDKVCWPRSWRSIDIYGLLKHIRSISRQWYEGHRSLQFRVRRMILTAIERRCKLSGLHFWSRILNHRKLLLRHRSTILNGTLSDRRNDILCRNTSFRWRSILVLRLRHWTNRISSILSSSSRVGSTQLLQSCRSNGWSIFSSIGNRAADG
jgi:hypothetical protein